MVLTERARFGAEGGRSGREGGSAASMPGTGRSGERRAPTRTAARTPASVAFPSCHRAASGSRPLQGVLYIAFALISITGCGHDHSKVALPPASPRSGLPTARAYSSASASAATPRDAAVAAYTAFFRASDEALTAPPERIRPILGDFTTGWYLDSIIRQTVDEQAQHLEPWGHVIVHLTQVALQQGTATIHDCQDASNAGLASTQTHQLIPETRGTAHRNLTAKLTLGGDGRWRISELRQFKAMCHA
jgi:hypothetical protein